MPEATAPPQDPTPPRTAEATLTDGDVDDLFRDLSAQAQIQHISVKQAAGRHPASAAGGLDLARARALLHDAETHAVQLRYHHAGCLWVDTLTRAPNGYKLLRVQHG